MDIKNYEIDIRKHLLSKLKGKVDGIRVFAGANTGDTYYPAVIVTQTDSSALSSTYDSAGWHHVRYAFDVNVYTQGEHDRESAASIANLAANAMQELGFQMDSHDPNMGDRTQKYQRVVMRFTAIINTETDTTYRG